MKKRIINLLCVGMLLVSGCTANTDTKGGQSSTQSGTENQTKEAWEYVDGAFEKLKKGKFSYEGIETEFAHVGEQNGELKATFDQRSIKADVVEYGKEMQITEGVSAMNFTKGNRINFLASTEEAEISMKTAKTNYTDDFTVYSIKDNQVVSDDGRTNESLEQFVDTSDGSRNGEGLVHKIDAITSNLGSDFLDFFMRGKTRIRLFPNRYFEGEKKETENGTEVIFTFTPDSKQYEEFLKSDIYQMMYDAYCVIDTVDENHNLAFKDELKEAKIVYKFDKEGYPVSYERYSNMYIEKFDQTYPYVVSYTFERK